MAPQLLLLAVLAGHTAPAPPGLIAPELFAGCTHDLATLSDAEARQLDGRRALYQVVVDSEPDGDPQAGWRYDCQGEGRAYRSLSLRDGDDLVAYEASQGSGLLVVEATLRRIVHASVKGVDGSSLPELVEYRLTGTRVVDTPER
jgi:hypothetical protein